MSINNYSDKDIIATFHQVQSIIKIDDKLFITLKDSEQNMAFSIDETMPGTLMHDLFKLIEKHLVVK